MSDDWRPRWWNPWATIRKLKADVLDAEKRAEFFESRTHHAESDAFMRAKAYYDQQTIALQAHNTALLEKIVELSSLRLPDPIVAPFAATTIGKARP